ncbi:c-type cytochrome [Noviherbaspirillum galbum]|uniref:C-type cytochrome n=1 Tax=Noviherbaspirillum galbum TaxID=2709383 RepID=A0A6B3SW41_9BURK|nr:c-type cytochrome [Noviherbaspirillum galbum]NEX64884.1 c-type cytochrome [Noviherbaspirillum galbum]
MKTWICIGMTLAVCTSLAHANGNALRGQALYQSLCAGCHSIDYNGVGPAHKGVFGRKAGSAPDYDYSPALKSSSIIWTAATLDRWLSDPEKLVPGQKMGIQVPSAADRADLIIYLREFTRQP